MAEPTLVYPNLYNENGQVVLTSIPTSFQIGTVTLLPSGSAAIVSISGEPPAYTINFGIPKGDQGDEGEQGIPGVAGNLTQEFIDGLAEALAAVAAASASATASADSETSAAASASTATTQAGLSTTARIAAEAAAATALGLALSTGLPAYYATKAAMTAALASHANGVSVGVLADESLGGAFTVYTKTGGVWVYTRQISGVDSKNPVDIAVLRTAGFTYTAGSALSVTAGEVITTRKDGWAFIVADSAATDYEEASSGGAKLYRASKARVNGTMSQGRNAVPAVVKTNHLVHLHSNWTADYLGSWTVTGIKGSKTLTYVSGSAIAGVAPANSYPAAPVAMISTDEKQFLAALVTGTNGTNEIYLREPLEKNFAGAIYSWHDFPNGQHITPNATRVWARAIAEATEFECCQGEHFGLMYTRDKRAITPWAANTAYAAAGANDGGTVPDIVYKHNFASITSSANATTGNMQTTGNMTAIPRATQNGRHSVGVWAIGHGAEFRTNCRGGNAFVEGFVGATHPQRNLTSYYGTIDSIQIRVRMTQNGVVIYDKVQNAALRMHRKKLYRAGEVKIEVILETATPIYLELADWSLRKAGDGGRLVLPSDRVMLRMDSWGAANAEVVSGPGGVLTRRGTVGRELVAVTGCQLVDKSEGSRSGLWVLGHMEDDILKYRPDVYITDMVINDSSLGTNAYFTAPDGVVYPEYLGEGYIHPMLTNANTVNGNQVAPLVQKNLLRMHELCQKYGVRLVYVNPGPVAGTAQTAALAGVYPFMEYAAFPADLAPTDALDFSNAHSTVNEYGKYPGKQLWHKGLSKVYVAQGYDRTSPWAQLDTPATTITPTDAQAPVFLSRTSQNVKTGEALIFALQVDEPVTFTITGGADQALFSLGASIDDRTQMLVLPAQSFGAPADADANNTYVVQVTATDIGGNATNQTVTITVRA